MTSGLALACRDGPGAFGAPEAGDIPPWDGVDGVALDYPMGKAGRRAARPVIPGHQASASPGIGGGNSVRGVDVSYETIRRWTVKFERLFAYVLWRRQPRPGDV